MDKLTEAEKWREIAFSRSIGSSKGVSTDFVKANHNPDKAIDAIIKSADYQREAERISESMVELKHTIETQISNINNDEYYNILHSYYIDEKSLNDISKELKSTYSYKSAKRKYEAAVNHFEELYGECYL